MADRLDTEDVATEPLVPNKEQDKSNCFIRRHLGGKATFFSHQLYRAVLSFVQPTDLGLLMENQ